jgi:hypothetical protein
MSDCATTQAILSIDWPLHSLDLISLSEEQCDTEVKKSHTFMAQFSGQI